MILENPLYQSGRGGGVMEQQCSIFFCLKVAKILMQRKFSVTDESIDFCHFCTIVRKPIKTRRNSEILTTI